MLSGDTLISMCPGAVSLGGAVLRVMCLYTSSRKLAQTPLYIVVHIVFRGIVQPSPMRSRQTITWSD